MEITRTENINDTNWTISYDSNSGKTLSISASNSENEKKSKYYNWLAYYHGDNSTYVVHSIELYGTPCGEGWFQIIQTETYKSGWQCYDAEDLAKWQQHYVPDCSLDESGRLVFYTRITRYDEKILFKPNIITTVAPIVTENTRLKFILDSTGEIIITGDNLANIEVVYDSNNGYVVALQLNEYGTNRYNTIATNHFGETISIVIIDKNKNESIVSSPTINGLISNGKVLITLSGDRESADALYNQMVGNI